MIHSFDIEIAKEYGITEAILLNNIYFWIEKNKANNQNFYDEHYWTYNSKKAFTELFPYLTERQIEYALKKLVNEGLIITGNYNKSAYDRTLWYAITKKGYSILQNCGMETTKLLNRTHEIVEPIPDINTDINTDNINTSKSDDVGRENPPSDESSEKEAGIIDNFETLWKLYPKKEGKNQAYNHYRAWLKGRKFAGKTKKLTREQMWYAITEYAKKVKTWDRQYIKDGSTFFNNAIYEYAPSLEEVEERMNDSG